MSEKNLPRPVETPAEWLRFAEENLAVVEREMSYEQPAFHTVCFLCQGAAEKYLKAYLIAQGWLLEKTHDIAALLELCLGYDEAFADLLEVGSVLNEYITAGRYPGDLAFEAIEKDQAAEAVEIVRKIKAVVMERMNV